MRPFRRFRFNSRPSCDGRPRIEAPCIWRSVSIHARHATGDRWSRSVRTPSASFNSRPSCDGRQVRSRGLRRGGRFNSRPSCDGRQTGSRPCRRQASFNSRPSCDGRPKIKLEPGWDYKFQFTPVMRRATRKIYFLYKFACFNSRPSCDGRHQRIAKNMTSAGGFNSRPSCDGRPRRAGRDPDPSVSIHARHATGDLYAATAERIASVSIHARHATGDAAPLHKLNLRNGFNSRPSCDGRRG